MQIETITDSDIRDKLATQYCQVYDFWRLNRENPSPSRDVLCAYIAGWNDCLEHSLRLKTLIEFAAKERAQFRAEVKRLKQALADKKSQ